MSRAAHAVLLLFILVFASLGTAALSAPLVQSGEIHLTNAIVGGVSLLLALALAFPLKLGEALTALRPAVAMAHDAKEVCA